MKILLLLFFPSLIFAGSYEVKTNDPVSMNKYFREVLKDIPGIIFQEPNKFAEDRCKKINGKPAVIIFTPFGIEVRCATGVPYTIREIKVTCNQLRMRVHSFTTYKIICTNET